MLKINYNKELNLTKSEIEMVFKEWYSRWAAEPEEFIPLDDFTPYEYAEDAVLEFFTIYNELYT